VQVRPEAVTALLEDINGGDPKAFDALVTLVYGELRRMAAGLLRRQASGRTLQPTALVNEAYLRLVRSQPRWDNRAHFFGAAARAMRQVLITRARAHAAEKRLAPGARVTLEDLQVASAESPVDLLALDEALDALAQVDERFTRVMELRYFGGYTLEEIAGMTERSLASVKRDFAYAREWLYDRMKS
jgi:RNA polymerase sigma-70 factor (ECF subfamily)